ncbi:WD repeat-containing protein 90, partial [Cladochytrium tenue]
VQFHPFGEFLASGARDGALRIWDVRRKGCIQTYPAAAAGGGADGDGFGGVSAARISPDGRWVATGSADGAVKLWDMTAGKQLATLTESNLAPGGGGSAAVRRLVFNPVEFVLAAVADGEARVRLFDLEALSALPALELPATGRAGAGAAPPRALEFLADGDALCVASDAELQVWTCEPPVLREAQAAGWRGLSDIKLLRNGKLIGASVQQSVVSVWGVNLESQPPEDEDGNPDASNDGAEHATPTPRHSATAAARHRDTATAVVADSDSAAAVRRSRSAGS